MRMVREHCPICDARAVVVTEEREVRIGARVTRVPEEFYRCTECSEEFFRPEQMNAAQIRASERIRTEDDLLSPSEIRAIRQGLGLSQRDFETLLRIGPKTVVRWEKGTVFQNRATDSLLRVVREFPEAARFLAERSGVAIRRTAA